MVQDFFLVLDQARLTFVRLAMTNPHFVGMSTARSLNSFKVPVMRDAIIAESLRDNRLAHQSVALGTINNRIAKTIKIVCVIQIKSNHSSHRTRRQTPPCNK